MKLIEELSVEYQKRKREALVPIRTNQNKANSRRASRYLFYNIIKLY